MTEPKVITKNAMTSSMTWPAIMLAAKRTDKLTGRTRYEKNSSTNMSGAIHSGVPSGRNILKKPKPFLAIVANTQTRKIIIASVNVMEIWLVCANVPGISPIKFSNSTNANMENTNGTYFLPTSPSELLTIFRIVNSDHSSADCRLFGINLLQRLRQNPNTRPINTTAPRTIEPFVKLKFRPKASILTTFVSSN